MKKFCKFMLFIIIFIVIYMALSVLFLPKQNLLKYGLYTTSANTILGEDPNTIDTIIKQTDTVFKGQVCRLIGEKIQLFDDMELVCENTYSAPKQANNQAA